MGNHSELVCTIYIDIDCSQEALVSRLEELLSGMVMRNTWPSILFVPNLTDAHINSSGDNAISPDAEIDIIPNENFDALQRREFPGGFNNFRYRVEVYSSNKQPNSRLLRLASDILENMWSNGHPAVAACNFEEQLPRNGGYRSLDLPWPKEG